MVAGGASDGIEEASRQTPCSNHREELYMTLFELLGTSLWARVKTESRTFGSAGREPFY